MSGNWSNPSLPEPVREALATLQQASLENRLAHAYVIAGDSVAWGVLLARLMVQQLFCDQATKPCGECRGCQLVETRRHADVQWLEPEMKSRVIGIDPLREVNVFLRQTSFEGGWKAVVITHADRMSDSAANAFLKTLEEPPARCLMLLVTDQPQSLLPTIASRCQQIPVGSGRQGERPPSRVEKAMLDWLRRRHAGEGPASMEQSAWISAILREVRATAEAASKEHAGDEVDDDVIKARVESVVKGARAEILRTIYLWERDVLASAYGAGEAELHFPADATTLAAQAQGRTLTGHLNRLERVDKARRLLEGNLPETAVWEAMLPA